MDGERIVFNNGLFAFCRRRNNYSLRNLIFPSDSFVVQSLKQIAWQTAVMDANSQEEQREQQQQEQNNVSAAEMNWESAAKKLVAIYNNAIGSERTLERWQTTVHTMDGGAFLRAVRDRVSSFPLCNPLVLISLLMPFLFGTTILVLIPGFLFFLISCLLLPAIFVVPTALFLVFILDQFPTGKGSSHFLPERVQILNSEGTKQTTTKQGEGEPNAVNTIAYQQSHWWCENIAKFEFVSVRQMPNQLFMPFL